MMDIKQRAYDVLKVLVNDQNPDIQMNDQLVLNDIAGFDSIFFLEMVSAFEKEFQFKFNLEDLIEVNTVGDFVNIIQTHFSDGL